MNEQLSKLGRFSWTLHNVIAHPLSELLYLIGYEDLGNKIHDATIPKHKRGEGERIMKKETPFKEATTPLLDEGLRVNDQPLQIASQDQILRRYELGGPDSLRDTRLYLDRADLEHLLQIAKASLLVGLCFLALA